MTVHVGEKGVAWRRLRVKGTPGHGSMPYGADNALVKAAHVIRRIAEYEPVRRYGPETEALMRALTDGELPPVEEAVECAAAIHPLAAAAIERVVAGLTGTAAGRRESA